MPSRVRPGDTLKICLEVNKVPRKRVHVVIHIRSRQRCIDQQQRVCRYAGDYYETVGLKSEVAADVMRDGVGESDIFETASRDLKIILWVTPRPETVNSGVGPHRRVVIVRGIYFRVKIGIQYRWLKALPCVQSQ